jgi:hypothetical protein
MTREEAIAYFNETESMCQSLSTDWQAGSTPTGEGILARLIPQQDPEPVLTFDIYADPNDIRFVIEAPARMGFLIRLVKSLKRRNENFEGPPRPPEKPTDYAAQCAILCAKPVFQRFLTEMHGLANQNKEAAASRVRSILNIKTRADLNDNPAAAEGWLRLFGEFEAWRKVR